MTAAGEPADDAHAAPTSAWQPGARPGWKTWADRGARAAHLAYFALVDGPRGRGRPRPVGSWDAQWAAGTWDYLASPDELPRYGVVASCVRRARPRPSVLDVGCGHGELLATLGPEWPSRYHGIDLSSAAVEQARARYPDAATFEVADLATWTSRELYDVIVVNEVLYYVSDPAGQVDRYRHMLEPKGMVIISMFRHGNTRLIWRELRRRLPIVDVAEVKNRIGEVVDIKLVPGD